MICYAGLSRNLVSTWIIEVMECVEFMTAKLLRKAGFRRGSAAFYHRYPSDYVYDGDPSHPESHRKGEVYLYTMYLKNDVKEDRYSYEAPSQQEVVEWLIGNYHLLVVVDTAKGGGFVAHVKRLGEMEPLCTSKAFPFYRMAVEAGIQLVLRRALDLLSAHCSECRYYEASPNGQMYCKCKQKALTDRTKRCAMFAYP